MNTFGERLKFLRRSMQITQEELANNLEELGCTATTKSAISQYENNKRLPDTKALVLISEYFRVSSDYLLCLNGVNMQENDLLMLYRNLGDNKRLMLIAYANALYDTNSTSDKV